MPLWIFLIIAAVGGLATLHFLLVIATLKSAVSAYNAGLPKIMVRQAQKALRLGAYGEPRILAHNIIGLGYAAQNKTDSAIRHYQKALELASKAKNLKLTAQAMTLLAGQQRRQGHLAAALQISEQAVSLSLESARDSLISLEECLFAWGRFEEARQVLHRARSMPPLATPALEHRSQGILSLALATLEAEAGLPDIAQSHIQEASVALHDDPKLSLWCVATTAWISAMQGRRDEALEKARYTETHAGDFPQDRDTLLCCLSMLGRVFFYLGDYVESISWWERYLAANPDPVWLPRGYYFLAECHLAQGELEATRTAFQQAASRNLDTWYARCAHSRLQQLEKENSASVSL